jgi:hypothetical protein
MKRAFLAATALLATSVSPTFTTPAFAAPPPINDTSGLTPQQVCDEQLTPDEHSDFTTFPSNESTGDWVTVGTDLGDPIGDPYGVGTPVPSNVFLSDSYFRNGGSPNVWALAEADLTYPQTGQMFETVVHQQRTTTFDCTVQKVVGSGSTIEPDGLQSTGNSTIETQDVPGDPQEVITNDPFVVQGATVHALICISPNNVTKGKPGTWTGKNGFNAADCPAASIAAGGTVPSDNAPDI